MTGTAPLAGLRVGHFGHFDPEYARNRILAKALRRAGAAVFPISHQGRFLSRTPRLIRGTAGMDLDLILVGFPGHSDVATAKLASLSGSAPVILDLLTSLWETELDRSGKGSWRSRVTDQVAGRLADAVWLDTKAHVDWYSRELGIPAAKLRRVWVGADDELMRPAPAPPPRDHFQVFFYGTFIPLQGIEHIVNAAALLAEEERIRFVLCGDGQTHHSVLRLAARRRLANVEFVTRRPPAALAELIGESDLCLGIFGDSEKARLVVPNKVFDALACARAVVTADTPAARECLSDGKTAFLCRGADPEALAQTITRVAGDDATRLQVAASGHRLFQERFSLGALARDLPAAVAAVLH